MLCSLWTPCYLFPLLQPHPAVRIHQHHLLITVAFMLFLNSLVESWRDLCADFHKLVSIIMQYKNINCIQFINHVDDSSYWIFSCTLMFIHDLKASSCLFNKEFQLKETLCPFLRYFCTLHCVFSVTLHCYTSVTSHFYLPWGHCTLL